MPRPLDETYALPPRPPTETAIQWLCACLRADIQSGRLQPGARLPSSRYLADLAGTARGTVVAALEQLQAEGYLVARSRSGTFVAGRAPTAATRPTRARPAAAVTPLYAPAVEGDRRSGTRPS